MGAHTKVRRGNDTSGRPLYATKQMFQHFDRVNDVVGGVLVPVQGSFIRGTAASADTHWYAGCFDVRTWNLTTEVRHKAMRAGRDPEIVGGAAWWYRTVAQGFDNHIHLMLLGDAPLSNGARYQAVEYRLGRNGLKSRGADDFWRPARITNYKYIEDDMFTNEDRALLQRIARGLSTFRENELSRDQAEAERDRKRFTAIISKMGGVVDSLAALEAKTADAATKTALRQEREKLLLALKNDPDVTGVDNPSDDALAEENMG